MTVSLEQTATDLFINFTKFDLKTIVLVARATFAGWQHHIAETKMKMVQSFNVSGPVHNN